MTTYRKRLAVLAIAISLVLAAVAICLCWRPTAGPTLKATEPDVVTSWREDHFFTLDVSPSGTLVAGAYSATDGTKRTYAIKVWDLKTGEQVARFEEGAETNGLAFSADGRLLAWGVTGDTVRVRETRTWRDHAVILPMYVFPSPISFSPDGKALAIGGGTDDSAVLWGLSPGARWVNLPGHGLGVGCLAFSPDGKRLVTVGARGPIHVWRCPEGKQVATLAEHLPEGDTAVGFRAVTFAPDGRSFATAGADLALRFWHLGGDPDDQPRQDRAVKTPFYSPDGRSRLALTSLAYSPDGAVLAVGCSNTYGRPGQVLFWDVSAARYVAARRTRPGFVNFLRFIQRGSRLVVGTDNGRESHVEVWDVDGGASPRH